MAADNELVMSRLLNAPRALAFDASAQQFEEMNKFGAVEGGKQTLDRLEAYLAG